ncbi:HlyD family efflux transporter periplasmic adaptor subunit [Bacteroidales bacterium]|nr:HlyD family efflux transporter periplasmic adaptor subunit [Bacteroidales bacterium]
MKTYFIPQILILLALVTCNTKENEPDAYGNFEAREIIVSAEAGGKIIWLTAEEGTKITEGVTVGAIDTIALHLKRVQTIRQKNAIATKLPSVDANIGVLNAQLKTLETEHRRIKKLVANEAAPIQKLDDIQGKLSVLKSRIKLTQVQKESIYAELKTIDAQINIIQQNISNCYISNPIEGTVLEIYTRNKELVAPGKSIYKIADLNNMDLKAYVSGKQLASIKIGQNVKVFIDSDSNIPIEYEGSITWISDKAEFTPKIIQTKEERVNLVYAIKISVKNDGNIKIGMPAEVKFE